MESGEVSRSHKIRRKGAESGVALLLAIFVLLLVAVVGIAMMAASGTETSLSANYRSSTAAYYAAMSGLEEGRARLLPKNTNYLGNASPPAIPPLGTSLPLGNLIYIVNPAPGEAFDTTQTYPDTEYSKDFPYPPSGTPRIVSSVATFAGQPNALYKWVRINAVDEWGLEVDVNDSNHADYYAQLNMPNTIQFDGTNLTRDATVPYQALEVTALAALPDGSRKLLQYVVGPITLQIPVAAALTLSGPGTTANVATFNPPPGATSFYVNGNDQCGPPLLLPAVGVTKEKDYVSVDGSLSTPNPNKDHYTGAGGYLPNVSRSPYVNPVNSAVNFTDPVSIANFLPTLKNAADSVLNGPRTEGDMPPAMSSSNPMTVYVDGDLSLTGFTGYGLLVVRGNLTYTGNSGWKGIVIVLGGRMEEVGSLDGGEFDGAVIVVNLTVGGGGGGVTLGPPTYIVASPGGKGIYYNSCWVNTAEKPYMYKVVSFREVPYP
ncbi:MAG: hypothetical protein NVS9B14_10070 [Candidatus Acidiferrum sp.]